MIMKLTLSVPGRYYGISFGDMADARILSDIYRPVT
jgi:hypothetical protein